MNAEWVFSFPFSLSCSEKGEFDDAPTSSQSTVTRRLNKWREDLEYEAMPQGADYSAPLIPTSNAVVVARLVSQLRLGNMVVGETVLDAIPFSFGEWLDKAHRNAALS